MKKILSLAITLMMVLSIASIPAMAADLYAGAYALDVGSSITEYTHAQFTADFAAATYTAFENFETFSADTYNVYTGYENLATGGHRSMTFAPAVSGVENATFSLTLKPTVGTLGMFQATDASLLSAVSSGQHALLTVKQNTGNPGGIKMTVADTENAVMVGGEAQAEYKIKALGFVVQYGSARKEMTYTVTYDSGNSLTLTTAQLEAGRTTPRFFGFKAPEGEYITGVTIDTKAQDGSFVIDDLGIIFEKEVIFPDGAYALGVGSSITDYTHEQFTADFKAADYTAFEKFETFSADTYNVYTGYENLATGGHRSMTFAPAVSGVEDATFSLTLKPTVGTLGMFQATDASLLSAVSSGQHALLTVKQNTGNPGGIKMTVADTENAVMVDGEAQDEYKIKALGFVVQYGSARKAMTYTVTYDSGDPLTVTTDQLASGRTTPRFFGFKAPEGKYITGVTIDTADQAGSFVIDDLGIIFDKVPAISFSTDAAGDSIISSLKDVSGDVYVNIKAGAFENEKVILALYGGDELLDVAIANAGDIQAKAKVPTGKTLTGIKAFVWDFANGLIPVQEPVEINR